MLCRVKRILRSQLATRHKLLSKQQQIAFFYYIYENGMTVVMITMLSHAHINHFLTFKVFSGLLNLLLRKLLFYLSASLVLGNVQPRQVFFQILISLYLDSACV